MMAFSVTGCGGGAKETTAAAAADTTAAGYEAEKVSEAVTEAAKEEGKKIEDMTVGVVLLYIQRHIYFKRPYRPGRVLKGSWD